MFSESKPRRADALRNEGKIVEAALSRFSRQGVDASLDGIARAAGVGPGTLYRHFPTRNTLIASALEQCQLELHSVLESLLESDDALSALREWLGVVRDYVRTFRGLAALLLEAISSPDSALHRTCMEMQDITAQLIQRAQQAGVVRPNIDARDLFVAQLALACVEDSVADSRTLECLLRDGYAAPESG